MRSLRFRTFLDQPIVSIALVVVNALVFMTCNYNDALYAWGRLDLYDVMVGKEYGRIVWSMFLHSDTAHIFNNMLLLFFMGSMIEREVGHIQYALLYFLSGIGGGIFSLLVKYMNHDLSGSIGASGAVFGLDGVLLAMVLFSGRSMENVSPGRVVLMIAYSLYSGFTGENIDNAAHVGGLITGFVLASIMCILRRLKGSASK